MLWIFWATQWHCQTIPHLPIFGHFPEYVVWTPSTRSLWRQTPLGFTLWIFDGQLMGSTFSGKTVQKFQGSSKKYPGEVLCPFNISIDYAKNTSDLHQISAMDLPTPSGVPTNPGGDFWIDTCGFFWGFISANPQKKDAERWWWFFSIILVGFSPDFYLEMGVARDEHLRMCFNLWVD